MLLCLGKAKLHCSNFLQKIFSKSFFYKVMEHFLHDDVGRKYNVCGMGLIMKISKIEEAKYRFDILHIHFDKRTLL